MSGDGNATILVVDDIPENVRLLDAVLAPRGWYAPSGEALRSTRMRPVTHSPTLLAAVDPTGRLAGAPAEVAAIARRFPAEAVRVLWDAEAVEEPSSTPPPTARTSISHRTPSTAGRTRWRHGLHMYGGTSLDVAEVVARMDLAGARLPTLSACETGISEYAIQPDEYVGLPAGFLEAGAQGVVSSLWAVSDIPTTRPRHSPGPFELAQASRHHRGRSVRHDPRLSRQH